MIAEKINLFAHSNEEIYGLILEVFEDAAQKCVSSIEEGRHCYLIENEVIDSDKIEEFCKRLYEMKVYFYVSVESDNIFQQETYEPNYEKECVEHFYVPEEYADADTGLKKICAIIFHSKVEKIDMKKDGDK